MTPTIRTLPLLAGAYKGGRAALRVLLTHSIADGGETTLCGRIDAGNVCDEYGSTLEEQLEPPTCPGCLRRDPRFKITRSKTMDTPTLRVARYLRAAEAYYRKPDRSPQSEVRYAAVLDGYWSRMSEPERQLAERRFLRAGIEAAS